MKLRYLISMLILLIGIESCGDHDEEEVIYVQHQPHSMRVKKISGYNEFWKEFVLEVSYVNNKVIAVNRFNKTGRQMGDLNIRREQGKIYYELRDYVPAIDADSIFRLDALYKELYGEGNYNLEDSIPLTATLIMSVALQVVEGVVVSQQFTYYQPTTDFGLGANFRPVYKAKNRETFVYEYGKNGCIQICRILSDVMDTENIQSFTRIAYKMEYHLSDQQVERCVIYQAGQYENDWKPVRDLKYNYSGNQLVSISGEGYSLQRELVNRNLTVNENGTIVSYMLNTQGMPTSIEKNDGKIMKIEYESGDGDFEIFTRMDCWQMGFPVIL